MTTWLKRRLCENRQKLSKPFCNCFESGCNKSLKLEEDNPGGSCKCGEHADVSEWQWDTPSDADASLVIMALDQKQVTFHPFYSSGTAMVRGNTPLSHDCHYYWEVKMLTEPYGTDIMVGVGTDKVDNAQSRYQFTSLLGLTAESYGLSYTGAIRHDDKVARDGAGFCKGSIIGVKVDLWQGTLEFFLNREPRGVSFYNLRRHPTQTLYPMVCSTAAQSSMRLIYASSWRASLLVDAAKILGASVNGDLALPPGLRNQLKEQFWLTLPNGSIVGEKKVFEMAVDPAPAADKPGPNNYVFHNEFPFTLNDYYIDNVSENYRVALIYDGIDNDL